MKKLIYFLLVLVISNIKIISQTTTEIPLKNGMVYYTFFNKIDNNKKCLKNYSDQLRGKCMMKSLELSTEKSKPFYGKNYSFSVSPPFMLRPINPNSVSTCIDTATLGALQIIFPTNNPTIMLYNFNKQKLISQSIRATMEIVFLTKSEYILKIKGFTLVQTTMSGTKSLIKEYELGELYQKYLSNPKKTKAETNLYNDINIFVNETDRIIRESFNEIYKTDELD
jgi:hypothetical protein